MIRDPSALQALEREIAALKAAHDRLDDDEADRRLAAIKAKYAAFCDREVELAAEEINRDFASKSKAIWNDASIAYVDDPAGRAWFRISFWLTTLHAWWVRCKWSIVWTAMKAKNWMALKWKRMREMAE